MTKDTHTPLDGRHLIAQSIEAMLGKRCEDFGDACPCCAAWREFDRARTQATALRRIAQSGGKPAAEIALAALRQTEGAEGTRRKAAAVPGVYTEGQGS